jgi:hypothetical protein
MSYTPEFRESIKHTIQMLRRQIDNSKEYINSEPMFETMYSQEHLENLIKKYDYLIETYPELII